MENCPDAAEGGACVSAACRKQRRGHDCDCPTIGCSQTDAGFTALFRHRRYSSQPRHPISMFGSFPGAPLRLISAFANRLSAAPLAPPPRRGLAGAHRRVIGGKAFRFSNNTDRLGGSPVHFIGRIFLSAIGVLGAARR